MGLLPTTKEQKTVFAAGLSSVAAAMAVPSAAEAAIRPKASGETKIVAVLGYSAWDNGAGQELKLRRIFSAKKDWRLICVRSTGTLRPALIADANLMIVSRGAGSDTVELSGADGGISDTVTSGAPFWTEANVRTIIDNVTNRGMGLIALNRCIASDNRQFNDFLDVVPLGPHDIEPLWITRYNHDHPITKGSGKFLIFHDQQYLAIIKSPTTATLFESTAVHEKRQGVSGWALDRGKGRVVGLLPGSTVDAFDAPEYRNIIWRSAHWALKRDIAAYPEAKNTLYNE